MPRRAPALRGRWVSAGRCEEALARRPGTPALLEGSVPDTAAPSRVCLACHSAAPEDGSPAASAALLWLGRGGLDPGSGAPLTGAAPASRVGRGCIGCHGGGPPELSRGSGHAFRAVRKEPADPSLAARARALFARISRAPGRGAPGEPPHAGKPRFDRATPGGRAAWDVALVLEDPAADVHNAAYARTLLDAAEAALGKAGAP